MYIVNNMTLCVKCVETASVRLRYDYSYYGTFGLPKSPFDRHIDRFTPTGVMTDQHTDTD